MNATGTPAWVAALEGVASAPIVPGDLWTLSWDGQYEGAVIVSRVADNHVLGIPVTNDEPSERDIAITVGDTSLSAWPHAETGLGDFLLHKRLGAALSPEEVTQARRWAVGRGELTTLRTGSGARDAVTFAEVLEAFRRRCFIEWPSQEEAVLDVAATGMNPREFHEATGIETGRIVELWEGHFLDADDRAALGERLGAWTRVAVDAPSRELSSPQVKELVMELCSASELSERAARNAARSAYALAARTETVSARVASRAADILRLLIEDARAS